MSSLCNAFDEVQFNFLLSIQIEIGIKSLVEVLIFIYFIVYILHCSMWIEKDNILGTKNVFHETFFFVGRQNTSTEKSFCGLIGKKPLDPTSFNSEAF